MALHRVAITVTLSFILIGCAARAVDSNDGSAAPGVAQQAFDSADQCADFKDADGTWGTEVISSDGLYGHGSTCPHQYVVGWGSLNSPHYSNAYPRWEASVTLDATTCPTAHMTIECYANSGSGFTLTDMMKVDGFWSDTNGCFWPPDPNYNNTCEMEGSTGNRTAVSAYTLNSGVKTFRKVGVDAYEY